MESESVYQSLWLDLQVVTVRKANLLLLGVEIPEQMGVVVNSNHLLSPVQSIR